MAPDWFRELLKKHLFKLDYGDGFDKNADEFWAEVEWRARLNLRTHNEFYAEQCPTHGESRVVGVDGRQCPTCAWSIADLGPAHLRDEAMD